MNRMQRMPVLLFCVMVFWAAQNCARPCHAFVGEYNSTSAYDMAVITAVKQTSDITFKVDNGRTITIIQRELVFGVSKSLSSKVKVYGGLNYGFDGEIEDVDYDLDNGYSATIGGRYGFIDESQYAVNCYAQLDYTFEGVYKNTDLEREYAVDGYDLLVGLLGKYRLYNNFSAYAAVEVAALSDYSEERRWQVPVQTEDGQQILQDEQSYDIELERLVGVKLGLFYDQYHWFLRADIEYGMGTGLGLTGGIKF